MSQIGMSDLGQADDGSTATSAIDAGAPVPAPAPAAPGFLDGLKAKWAGLSNVGKVGVVAVLGGGLWYAKKKRMF